MKRVLAKTLYLLLSCALAAIFLFCFRIPLLKAFALWLDVGRQASQADYIMILNGGENTRPFATAALVKAGYANRVLITTCSATPPVEERLCPPHHEIARLVLINRGVPAEAISFLPGNAASTFDEAEALGTFLRDKPDVRVLVVTNEYHTRRSRWVFSHILGNRKDHVTFVSAPTDDCPPDCWWRTLGGAMFIPTEYLKFLFYVFYYGYFGQWLAAFALLTTTVWLARRTIAKK